MRFTSLSNYQLIDWLIDDVMLIFVRIRINYNHCITSKPTNQQRFFQKSVYFFPVFEKRQGRPPPTPLFSYAPVVIRKCRTTLLTKFTIMKLKTDAFTVSKIFL